MTAITSLRITTTQRTPEVRAITALVFRVEIQCEANESATRSPLNRQLQRKLEKIEGELGAVGLKSELIKVPRKRKTTRSTMRRVARNRAAYAYHHAVQIAQDIYWAYKVTRKVIKNWPNIKAWFKSVGITQDEITTLGLAEMMRSPQKKRKKAKKRVKR